MKFREVMLVTAIVLVLSGVVALATQRNTGPLRPNLGEVEPIYQRNLAVLAVGAYLYTEDYDQKMWIGSYRLQGGVAFTWLDFLHPYSGLAGDTLLNKSQTRNVEKYTEFCSSSPPSPPPVVASHVVYLSSAPWNYWDWFGTQMWAGFPTGPTWNNPNQKGFRDVYDPSMAALFVPGALITYNPNFPGGYLGTIHGSACTWTWGPQTLPYTDLTQTVNVFHVGPAESDPDLSRGGFYVFSDLSVRLMRTSDVNRSNTALFNGQPAATFMQVRGSASRADVSNDKTPRPLPTPLLQGEALKPPKMTLP